MALSLEDVQDIKFGMTERAGYNVVDVDDFVDQVEASFAELHEANANLTRQLQAIRGNGAAPLSGETATTPASTPAGQTSATDGAEPDVTSPEVITVTTSSEASAAVTRLVQMSTEHAESVVAEAEAEAARIRAEADQDAKQLTDDATARAERVQTEAQTHADEVRDRAQDDADQLEQQTERRRQEMMSELETERDQLAGSVAELRTHEDHFRQALTDELRGYIDTLSGRNAEPSPAPAALADARPIGAGQESAADADQSEPFTDAPEAQTDPDHDATADPDGAADTENAGATPRLDALLNEDQAPQTS